MQRLAHFAIIFYLRYWLAELSAPRAPRTDLKYLRKLKNFDDKQVTAVAAKVFCRHLCYLNGELEPLAFLDDGVSNDLKLQMIQALKKTAIERSNNIIDIDYLYNAVSVQTLASFISMKCRTLLEKLLLPTSFPQIDPSNWNENEYYTRAKDYVEKNECCERQC